ncbi:transmembrane protein, putative, partial [Bodo saltans]
MTAQVVRKPRNLSIHTACVRIVDRCSARVQRSSRCNLVVIPTVLGRWLADDGRRRHGVLKRLRYPNLSVSVVLLFTPGVLRAAVAVIADLSNDRLPNDRVGEAAAVVGLLCLICSAIALECLVYRHVEHSLEEKSPDHFRFADYRHLATLASPIPPKVARCVLPQGRWDFRGPEMSRKSFGGIVSNLTDRGRRAWCVLPLSNAVVQILNAVGGKASQQLYLRVYLCSLGYFRPHRAVLASYLTCVSLLLSCLVTLLAMLCRLGNVDRSAVDGFGVFVSVGMMLMKAYHIALPHVEAWLIGRNKIQPPPHRTTAQVPQTATLALPMEPPGRRTSIAERSGLLRASQLTTYPLVALREEKQTDSVAAAGDRQRIILSKLV